MSAGKGDKVANNYRTKQWENSKLWKKQDNQAVLESVTEEELKKLNMERRNNKCHARLLKGRDMG